LNPSTLGRKRPKGVDVDADTADSDDNTGLLALSWKEIVHLARGWMDDNILRLDELFLDISRDKSNIGLRHVRERIDCMTCGIPERPVYTSESLMGIRLPQVPICRGDTHGFHSKYSRYYLFPPLPWLALPDPPLFKFLLFRL